MKYPPPLLRATVGEVWSGLPDEARLKDHGLSYNLENEKPAFAFQALAGEVGMTGFS